MERLGIDSVLDKPTAASEVYDRLALEAEAQELIDNCEKVEHDQWEKEPLINARTAIFEELTAKGHLSRIQFSEDPDTVHSLTVRRLLNGWSDDLPDFEKRRRFSEIVEELYIRNVWQDIQSGKLPPDTMIVTISDIPRQAASQDILFSLGYGVLNDKGMVRGTDFEDGSRQIEQISRSNSADHSSELFFKVNDISPGGYDSGEVLARQILMRKSQLSDGIIDVQRALDSLAGPNIIYGEDRAQPDLNVPDYENLRAVSAFREWQAQQFIERLAKTEEYLNIDYKAGLINYAQKLERYNTERRRIVNEICLLDPSYAKDARGAASAEHFKKAALAMAAGDDTAGAVAFEMALDASDPLAGAVCGGGGVLQPSRAEEARESYLRAKENREDWVWRKGICIVDVCPSRPGKVEVGPCSVCRKCQSIFDNGEKPRSVYKTRGFLDILFAAISEEYQRQKVKEEQGRQINLKKRQTKEVRESRQNA